MYLILEDLTLEVWQLIESNGFVFVKLNTPTYTEGTRPTHRVHDAHGLRSL